MKLLFWNFIGVVMIFCYHDYIDEVWNKSESIYKNYKIFCTSMCFTEFTEIDVNFKQTNVHYNDKPKYLYRLSFNAYYTFKIMH